MKKVFAVSVLTLILAAAAVAAAAAIPAFSVREEGHVTIVIDPGHGGEDGGAVSADGLLESEVNLAIALRLDQLLGLCGIPASLTRSEDTIAYPEEAVTTRQRKRADQEYRVSLVNGTPQAVLLSIHQNKYSSAAPKGPQVFFGMPAGSEAFGKHLQEILRRLTGTRRQAVPVSEEIYLLRQAACPSVLVECGFLSNPEESELLRTDAYRTKLAAALAAGCFSAIQELEHCHGEA